MQRSVGLPCCRWKRCVPIACAEAERKFASMGRFVLVLVRSAKCWPALRSRRWCCTTNHALGGMDILSAESVN